MTFDIVTIFPAMIEQPLAMGILGRAIDRGTLDLKVRDLRDFTTDRHRVVDDVPYGGGPGMVLKPDPIFRALDAIEAERGTPLTVIKEFSSIIRDGLAGRVNEEQREYLEIVVSRVDDLATMVEDMLDTSRLEAAKKMSSVRLMPTANMWCAHTLKLMKTMAIVAAAMNS